MPLSKVLQLLDSCGIPATVEFPGGTWGHSREYTIFVTKGQKALEKHLELEALNGSAVARKQLALLKGKVPAASDDGDSE